MEIKHVVHQNGIQSLGFQDAFGRYVTVEVAPPGEYDLGVAEHDEEFRVIQGSLKARGESYRSINNPLRFKKGERIVFSCGRFYVAVFIRAYCPKGK
jgi:uncharacterized protein YaiE (UPF0345 family)